MRYVLLLLLAGCAQLVPIDYANTPPPDWPKLDERITRVVQQSDLNRYCGGSAETAARSKGCYVINFKYNLCMIYLASADPAALTHERAHCRGYDHVGDFDRSRNAWERYKASQRASR